MQKTSDIEPIYIFNMEDVNRFRNIIQSNPIFSRDHHISRCLDLFCLIYQYVKEWIDGFSLIQFTLLQRDRVINSHIAKKTIYQLAFAALHYDKSITYSTSAVSAISIRTLLSTTIVYDQSNVWHSLSGNEST